MLNFTRSTAQSLVDDTEQDQTDGPKLRGIFRALKLNVLVEK